MPRLLSLLGALGCALGCGSPAELALAPGATCSLSAPSGAPARFLDCDDGAGERTVAILTPSSHCVPGGAAVVGAFECSRGTAVRLGAGCALAREAPSFDDETCTFLAAAAP